MYFLRYRNVELRIITPSYNETLYALHLAMVAAVKHSGMACVNDRSHSFTCPPPTQGNKPY